MGALHLAALGGHSSEDQNTPACPCLVSRSPTYLLCSSVTSRTSRPVYPVATILSHVGTWSCVIIRAIPSRFLADRRFVASADLIQGLVARGADINLANRQGLTPLHCAAQRVGSPSRNLSCYSSESERACVRACVRDASPGAWMFCACAVSIVLSLFFPLSSCLPHLI
jgi:hypothetical protein